MIFENNKYELSLNANSDQYVLLKAGDNDRFFLYGTNLVSWLRNQRFFKVYLSDIKKFNLRDGIVAFKKEVNSKDVLPESIEWGGALPSDLMPEFKAFKKSVRESGKPDVIEAFGEKFDLPDRSSLPECYRKYRDGGNDRLVILWGMQPPGYTHRIESPRSTPPPPILSSASATSQNSITLKWEGSTDPSITYEIERSTDGDNFTNIANVSGDLTYTDTGLASGTTSYYRVRATNRDGSSSYSSTRTGTTLSPDQPRSLWKKYWWLMALGAVLTIFIIVLLFPKLKDNTNSRNKISNSDLSGTATGVGFTDNKTPRNEISNSDPSGTATGVKPPPPESIPFPPEPEPRSVHIEIMPPKSSVSGEKPDAKREVEVLIEAALTPEPKQTDRYEVTIFDEAGNRRYSDSKKQIRVRLPAGNYRVKSLVKDEKGNVLGEKERKIELSEAGMIIK